MLHGTNDYPKIMRTPSVFTLTFILFLVFPCSSVASANEYQNFFECLAEEFLNYSSISNIIYTPSNSSYIPILQASIQNLRFISKSTPKPLLIITPEHESQIPPVINCAKESCLQIRTRSNGHDFEGLSYVSEVPFVVVDLINLRKITVDAKKKIAWVESGATIGYLYYKIAEQSPTLGFPAGVCTTIGVGGHFSGGGYGTMLRKYGLAADQVFDARIVDVNGRILERKSMGEDLFWAIRGGGGASFGIILAWKIQLVDVPKRVTVFTIVKTLEEGATQIIHRWQHIAHRFNKDLCIYVIVSKAASSQDGMTISASFKSLFLGGVDKLLPLMQESFPELGLVREDCIEMSWVQSILYFYGLPLEPIEALLNRTQPRPRSAKVKSDYVKTPISEHGLEGIWRLLNESESLMWLVPYGGRMDEIPESAVPFPHRAGNLFKIGYGTFWEEEDNQNSDKYINWTRRLYDYLAPYVSRFPREAYLNYRDLDIGVNNKKGDTSYAQASIWGFKYFKNNFNRLVRVKTMVDPENFFKNEQSIPALNSWSSM